MIKISTLRYRAGTARLLGTALLCSVTLLAATQTTTAVASGNWNNGATWGGSVPAAGNDAVIPPGITVTVTANATIKSVTFDNTGSAPAILNVQSGDVLTITTNLTLRNAADGSTQAAIGGAGKIIVNGALRVGDGTALNTSGTYAESATLTTTIDTLRVAGTATVTGYAAAATQTISGALTINAGSAVVVAGTVAANQTAPATAVITNGGTLTAGTALSGTGACVQDAGSFLNLGGTVPITTLTATAPGNTITYSGGAQTIRTMPYQNLGVSGTGIKSPAANLNISTNLSVSGTATLDLGTFTAGNTSGSGNLIVNNGATLRIGGTNSLPPNYFNYQLYAGSTVDYYGTTQTVDARNYGSLVISGGTATVNEALNVSGNITINSGSTLNGGAGNYVHTISGSWSNNGSFIADNCTVGFLGSAPQAISGSAPITFHKFYISNSKGLTVSTNTTVTNELNLSSGLITPTGGALVVVEDDAIVTGASNTSFVNGPLRKSGNDAFVFPVGKSGSGYHPIEISAPASAAVFTAQYMRQSAVLLDPDKAPGLDRISECEYWTLDRASGPAVDVTLHWNAGSPCGNGGYINDPSTVVVAHYNGSTWNSYGRDGGHTGNATAGSVTWRNVSTFSPFTIGTTDGTLNPLPVSLLSFEGRQTASGRFFTWRVGAEVSVAGYEVERRAAGGAFTSIGFVPATGSGSYTFTDAAPQRGLISYRLKIVDKDGGIAYSRILPFNTGAGLMAYPTVTRSNVTLVHEAVGAGALVSLSALDGRQVLVQRPQTGVSQTNVDLTPLRPGIYLLRFNDGKGNVETVKLIKE